jgi:hypothetical protein
MQTVRSMSASLVLVFTFTAARADVIYTTQDRRISAICDRFIASDPPVPNPIVASDFGAFVQTISHSTSIGSASADQASYLRADGIYASATAFGSHMNGFGTLASSTMSVGFHLDTPMPFSVSGDWNSGGGYGNASVSLAGALGSVFSFQRTTANPLGETFSRSGTLPAGTYTFEASVADSAPRMQGGIASFDVALTIPAPAAGTTLVIGALGFARRRRPR